MLSTIPILKSWKASAKFWVTNDVYHVFALSGPSPQVSRLHVHTTIACRWRRAVQWDWRQVRVVPLPCLDPRQRSTLYLNAITLANECHIDGKKLKCSRMCRKLPRLLKPSFTSVCNVQLIHYSLFWFQIQLELFFQETNFNAIF